MAQQRKSDPYVLCCPVCGNDKYFIQTVTFQRNLVSGGLVHIHQLESYAKAEHECRECGAIIEVPWLKPFER